MTEKQKLIEAYKNNAEEFIRLTDIIENHKDTGLLSSDEMLEYESAKVRLKLNYSNKKLLLSKLLPLLD